MDSGARVRQKVSSAPATVGVGPCIVGVLSVSNFLACGGGNDSSATTSTSTTTTTASQGSTTATTSTGTGGNVGSGGLGAVTVTGTVIDYSESPVPVETVMIGEKIAVTDPDGSFSVSEVTPPYTLRVVDQEIGVSDYVGLTSAHPTVQLFKLPIQSNQAFIDGTLSGASIPLSQGRRGRVQYSALLTSTSEYLEAGGGNSGSTFSIDPEFQGSTEQGQLRALTWSANASGVATSYLDYGSSSVILAPGGTFSPQIFLSPVSSGSVHLSVSLSGGQTIEQTRPTVEDNGASLFLHATVPSGNPVDLVTPQIPGGSLSVTVFAGEGNPASKTIAFVHEKSFTGDISISVPPTTTLDSPAAGAHLSVVGTTFKCTSPSDQLNAFFIGNYVVYTMEDSIIVPDLTSLGVHLGPGEIDSWGVIGFGPYDGVDAAVAEKPIYRDWQRVLNSLEPSAPTSDGYISRPYGNSLTAE